MYSGDGNGGQIYFSNDAGATWTDFTNNLVGTTLNPDGTVAGALTTEATSLQLFDPNPGTTDGEEVLIAGGRGGVYRRVPGLQKPGDLGPWKEYGIGLPNSYIQDIRLYNNDRLIAATFGRGSMGFAQCCGQHQHRHDRDHHRRRFGQPYDDDAGRGLFQAMSLSRMAWGTRCRSRCRASS